jgi:hypothetical protein
LAIVETVSAALVKGEALRVRIGIATGLTVVGERIGAGEAAEYTVVGETPNRAARLQSLTGPGGIVVDSATRSLVGDLFEVSALAAVSLKGLPGSVQAFEVRDERAIQSRFEALHGTRPTPLIGREEFEPPLRRWMHATAVVVLISASLALASRACWRHEGHLENGRDLPALFLLAHHQLPLYPASASSNLRGLGSTLPLPTGSASFDNRWPAPVLLKRTSRSSLLY